MFIIPVSMVPLPSVSSGWKANAVTSGPIRFTIEEREELKRPEDPGPGTTPDDKKMTLNKIETISGSGEKNGTDCRVALDRLGRNFPDPLGDVRWHQRPSIIDGQWLNTREIDCVAAGLCNLYSPIFRPVSAVFMPPAGVPEVGQERPIKKAMKHDIIIRIILQDNHFTALAHFRTLRSIILFNSYGLFDKNTLKSQLKIIPPAEGENNNNASAENYWVRIEKSGKYQKDGWSCGLWCLSFLKACLESILEQISISQATPDYNAAIDAIMWRLHQDRLKMLDVDEANRLIFKWMISPYRAL